MSIVQQLVGQIPWGHNITLLTKVKDSAEREWYAHAAIEYALKDIAKPVGISEYRLIESIPEDLQGDLPRWAYNDAFF